MDIPKGLYSLKKACRPKLPKGLYYLDEFAEKLRKEERMRRKKRSSIDNIVENYSPQPKDNTKGYGNDYKP